MGLGDILQPTHLLFILVVALLVLGPKRLPEAGRALGRGIRDFRTAISGDEQDGGSFMSNLTATSPAPTAVPPPPVMEPEPPPSVPETHNVPDVVVVPEAPAPPTSAQAEAREPASDSGQASEPEDHPSNSAAEPAEPAHTAS